MAAISEFASLVEALSNAGSYPSNGCGVEIHEYSLVSSMKKLRRISGDLFCADGRANVEFIDVFREDEDFHHQTLKTSESLQRYLRQTFEHQHRPDPRQRFIFVTAPTSRRALRITEQMWFQILSYNQVMTGFLDFVFPFGFQREPREPNFSRFRSRTYLDRPCRSLEVPQLQRSGKHIEMCYSLKSVEQGSGNQRWSIRQCSIHHKYDIVSQQASWIIIKAHDDIRIAVQERLRATRSDSVGFSGSKSSRLASSLDMHRLMCDLAGENWHEYISDLENELEVETRPALFNPHDGLRRHESPDPNNLEGVRYTQDCDQRHNTASKVLSYIKRTTSSYWRDESTLNLTPMDDLNTTPETPTVDVRFVPDTYTFDHLQKIQLKEDKAHEILLVLDGNCKVIENIRREYADVADRLDTDEIVHGECRLHLSRFQRHLSTVEDDLNALRSRLHTVLQKGASRRSLMQASIDYRNMQATQRMTTEMHRIAHKTAIETISMRIITVVTLIFLPGTFVSTLMSTPIVSFDGSPTPSWFSLENIGIGALELYLIVSLPLFFLTVLGFLFWYLPERKKEARKMQTTTEPFAEKA